MKTGLIDTNGIEIMGGDKIADMFQEYIVVYDEVTCKFGSLGRFEYEGSEFLFFQPFTDNHNMFTIVETGFVKNFNIQTADISQFESHENADS